MKIVMRVLLSLIVLLLFPLSSGRTQENQQEPGDHLDKYDLFVRSTSLELGWFAPRRSNFRDKFGTFLTGGLVVPLKKAFDGKISARLNYTYLRFSDYPAVYWDLSLVPTYSRVIDAESGTQWVGGVGGGLSMRRIGATIERRGLYDEVLGSIDTHKIQWNPILTFFVGPTFKRGANGGLYIRMTYNYHLGGGGDVGKFGDTGGFSLIFGKTL